MPPFFNDGTFIIKFKLCLAQFSEWKSFDLGVLGTGSSEDGLDIFFDSEGYRHQPCIFEIQRFISGVDGITVVCIGSGNSIVGGDEQGLFYTEVSDVEVDFVWINSSPPYLYLH